MKPSKNRFACMLLCMVLVFSTGCTSQGQVRCGGHPPGESWLAEDGCNTCTCTENGEACTESVCGTNKNCGAVSDKECSSEKPLYCDKGELVELCAVCGCPEGFSCTAEGGCEESRCGDSTRYGECSETRPLKCAEGILVEKASECGCPENSVRRGDFCVEMKFCDDGTEYGKCAKEKPGFCDDGAIVEKPSHCGCPENHTLLGGKCVDKFKTGEQARNFSYVLEGERHVLQLTLYKGLNDYLQGLPRVYYCDPDCPTDYDITMKFMDNERQREELLKLVELIRTKTGDSDDRARIAVSIVQNIPYDSKGVESSKLTNRYPYEVLFDGRGVCGEKSRLLAFLLRELGYGVALLDYIPENHQAVGILCPPKYSVDYSGYCFIESTGPSIITNDEGEYAAVGKLTSKPVITQMSNGSSFESVKQEYEDMRTFRRITSYAEFTEGRIDPHDYYLWQELIKRYGLAE